MSGVAERLIIDNLDFADKLAATFCRRYGVPEHAAEEMQSVARVGLCRAAQNFDPARGASFRTFCFSYIRGVMMTEVRDQRLRSRFGADECRQYLAEQGVDTYLIADADGDQPVIDLGRDGTADLETAVLAGDVRALVDGLDEREREVLRLRYADDVGFPELGRKIGVCRYYANRIHDAAIERLRKRWKRKAVKRTPTARTTLMPTPIDAKVSRADLVALRGRLEDEYQGRIRDVDAALRLFDSGLLGTVAVGAVEAPQPEKPRRRSAARKPGAPPGSLYRHFDAVLAGMPVRFTMKQIVAAVEQAIGRQVSPPTARACVERLVYGKRLVAHYGGKGRGRATVFERVDGDTEEADAA